MSAGPRILFFSVSLLAAACGGASEEREEPPIDRTAAAAAAGGTPAPDGSNGYCCPASTGGCAFTGGYRESGDCPKRANICDNMCEQRIVEDEHGCGKLTWKPPPVETSYAGPESCSDPRFNGGDRDP